MVIHIAASKEWKKGVNTIVLVEPVAKLFPVSVFWLDSVWTEARCVGQLTSNKKTFHCEHIFLLVLVFQMFKTVLQQCNFSCRWPRCPLISAWEIPAMIKNIKSSMVQFICCGQSFLSHAVWYCWPARIRCSFPSDALWIAWANGGKWTGS